MRGKRHLLPASALGAFLAIAVAVSAGAHHGSPATGESEPGALGEESGLTGATGISTANDGSLPVGGPVAKDGRAAGWQQIGGSQFRSDGTITELVEDSPTPYDLDFYGLGFLDKTIAHYDGLSLDGAAVAAKSNGFAVGAQCRREDPGQPVEPEATEDCERIPVIYRYYEHPTRGLIWEESYRGDDANDPGGFVGAVAWLSRERALAVGGTGTFPRNEPGCEIGTEGCPDPVGTARAWLYEDGSWRELQNKPDPEAGFTGADGDEIPDQMSGLTAAAASPRPFDCGEEVEDECAIVGGYRQLWHFADGRFTGGYGPELTDSGPLSDPSAFTSRVRDIRFFGDWRFVNGGGNFGPNRPERVDPGNPARVKAAAGAGLFVDSSGWHAGAAGRFLLLLRSRNGNSDSWPGTRLQSPPAGCQYDDPRPECDIFRVGSSPAGLGRSTAQLVSADGDTRRYCDEDGSPNCNSANRPDNLADWAVGVLRSSGRGVALNTAFRDAHVQGTQVTRPSQCFDDEELLPGAGIGTAGLNPGLGGGNLCSLDAYQEKQGSKSLYYLASYALNAYRVAAEDVVEGDEGVGWAAGDHGALLSRSGAIPAAEALPARSGTAIRSQAAAGPGAYPRDPVTAEPGQVPELGAGSRPVEPGFQGPFGQSDYQSEIVLSRDGSEGWSLEKFGTSVLHYDGVSWEPCAMGGVSGLIPADPVCSALAAVSTVQAMARIPLERDADPGNDDEFEAAALTDKGLFRYSQGRWRLDQSAVYRQPSGNQVDPVAGKDLAFTAPDDGWIVSSGFARPLEIIHFDGERWINCVTESPECGDPNSRIQIGPPCAGQNPQAQLEAAGERVYLIATRDVADRPLGANVCTLSTPRWQGERYPLILYHDRGGTWQGGIDPDWQNGVDTTPEDGYSPDDGGWDPGCIQTRTPVPGSGQGRCIGTGRLEDQGQIGSISVAADGDAYQGWAVGAFGGTRGVDADATALRLSDGSDVPEGGEGAVKWRPWLVRDAANDYLRASLGVPSPLQLTLPAAIGRKTAFMFPAPGQALGFDQGRSRWEAVPTPWAATAPNSALAYTTAGIDAIAPDGRGGFWAAGGRFYHYTDRAPDPVFEQAAQPAQGARVTAFSAGADGTLWLGDENGSVYRYDRLAGWSPRLRIPGWDPRIATSPADVNAVAAGPGGEGLAVGPGGRIAVLGEELRLDPAAIRACANEPLPPCGTGQDLLAAAIAPDGSALVGGRNRTLLWRPPAGDFGPAPAPPVPLATTIRKIVMPSPDEAWLLTDRDRVIAGEMPSPGAWRWRVEVGSAEGKPDPLTATGIGGDPYSRIEDIAVDAAGHGYAVGSLGVVLERSGDHDQPWRRIESGVREALQAVALPAGGGEGALIGGADGLLLTAGERGLRVARHADVLEPVVASGGQYGRIQGRFVGLGLVPGYRAGEIEAWGLLQGARLGLAAQSLFHHATPAADPRLDPTHGLAALPDSPEAGPEEVSFAAFGRQDCDSRRAGFRGALAARDACGPPDGSNITAGLIGRRIEDDLTRGPDRPAQFAIHTGDAVDTPGGTPVGAGATERGAVFPIQGAYLQTPLDQDIKHRRWVELVPHRLADLGLPVAGAIGGQDLARNAEYCTGGPGESIREVFLGGCISPRQGGLEQFGAQQGSNLAWRAAIASTPAPWGREQEGAGIRLEPVGAGPLSARGPDAGTPEGGTPGVSDLHPQAAALEQAAAFSSPRARIESYPLGSGDTHYAADVIRDGEKVARIVVADTSMRSIAASDPLQHPHEAGGQLRWLEEMLCRDGSTEDTGSAARDCTREPGQLAIVVSNTPTYSYGPISPEELQTDAAAFEAILLRHDADVLVTGHVGWSGRYWTLAPGVHAPCPGQPYRPDHEVPSLGDPEICGAAAGDGPQLPEETLEQTGQGILPVVVASTAGGTFNARAERGGFADANQGFWRGYSLVRLDPSGDSEKTIVEQRPILDSVGLTGPSNIVRPGQRIGLQGYAGEAYGMDAAPRYYPLNTAAITHRYELLAADPEAPWRPLVDSGQEEAPTAASTRIGESDPCGQYVCLDPKIGTIDDQSGRVRAGSGEYPRTYAFAQLSVGDRVAVFPMVFEPRSAFRAAAPIPPRPTPPPPPATPPDPPQPNAPTTEIPPPPAIPAVLAPSPLPPPVPPAPPTVVSQAPLDLNVAPTTLDIAPPTAVTQPPTPPVNPAPPSGARREARQRQAATQKSGADSAEEEGSEIQDAGGDLAGGRDALPGSSAATRHEFTALAHHDQPSALVRDALIGGGLGIAALVLALGLSGARPTPRRRRPEAPAPAWTRSTRR